MMRNPIQVVIDDVMLPYQRTDILSSDRFRRNCWSRQVGKSFSKSFRRLVRGISRKRDQLFLSAGERQSRELMTKARQHCENMQAAFEYSERDAGIFDGVIYKQLEITLPAAGIRIIGLPANPNTARGFTGDVFLDEFAMHQHDREIFASIYPSVLRGGGEMDIASTPRGRQNKFYELADNPEWNHQTVTIDDAVADGLAGIDIGQLRRAMGDEELFRQEFLCEFVDEATAFLTYEMIATCEDADLPRELDLDALRGHTGDVYVGVDIGRYRDFTVIWALDSRGDRLSSLGLIELQGVRFAEQFAVLCEVLDCRCVRRCSIDATGLGMQFAEQAVERFGEHRVEGHLFTAALKEAMGVKLRVRMEGGNIRIPADTEIRNDLHSVEKSVTIDGKIRLRATRQAGSHADRFWALALAVYGVVDGGPFEWEAGPPLSFAGARNV